MPAFTALAFLFCLNPLEIPNSIQFMVIPLVSQVMGIKCI